MTPPRSRAAGDPAVRPFPVFQVVVAADGTSATFNGQQIPTAGHPDLVTAVYAAAGAAATKVGRPVRMDLTTPTGQVRHLIAHPAATPPPTPQPGQARRRENPNALDEPGTPDGSVAHTTRAADPEPPRQGTRPRRRTVRRPRPCCVTAPRRRRDHSPDHPAGRPAQRPPPTPPPHPLDDPLPGHDAAARPADTPPPRPVQSAPKVDAPPAAPPIPVRRPGSAEDRWLFGHRDETAPPPPASSATADLSAAAAEPRTGGAPPAPVSPLQPAGLLPRLRPTIARPMVGWQARVHTWTRGRLTPAPSAAERRHRELVTAVQAPFTGPRLVAVINPKGGAGKTPAVLAAAATWGAHRGSVVAWDDGWAARSPPRSPPRRSSLRPEWCGTGGPRTARTWSSPSPAATPTAPPGTPRPPSTGSGGSPRLPSAAGRGRDGGAGPRSGSSS